LGKTWPALDIHVPGCDPQLQELVLAELDDFQPTAIQEPEEAQTLRAFFASAAARDAAAGRLGAEFGIHLFVESIDVGDEDWAARSQALLRAVTIGQVIVAPPWDIPETAVANSRVVVIQPSMGFGTGHHATTRLTLKALQSIDLNDRSVLDIGCGSGVLAIAAVSLGARSALGVDIDPDALANARENAGLNLVAQTTRFDERDFRDLSTPADVVLANLTGALLEKSAAKLAELVTPGGYLIVSGFMASEGEVVPALGRFLTLQEVEQEDEWRCAVFASLTTSTRTEESR
jgi:ribosomal protein L11 methyltransferase